jgi:hypothetical protein
VPPVIEVESPHTTEPLPPRYMPASAAPMSLSEHMRERSAGIMHPGAAPPADEVRLTQRERTVALG